MEDGEIDDEGIGIEENKEAKETRVDKEKDKERDQKEKERETHRHSRKRYKKTKEKRKSKRRRRDRQKVQQHLCFFQLWCPSKYHWKYNLFVHNEAKCPHGSKFLSLNLSLFIEHIIKQPKLSKMLYNKIA